MINKFSILRLANYVLMPFILCFVALIVETQAQVTVDSRSAGGAFSNTGVTTLSWTHTVGNGTNRALLVGISTTNQVATAPICSPAPCPPEFPTTPLLTSFSPLSSITNNGVPMTFVRVHGITSPMDQVTVYTHIYQLVNPSSGANNIVATFTPARVTHVSGNSVSFRGVNQTTPTINADSISGSNNSPFLAVNVFDVTSDDMVFDSLVSTPNAGFFLEGGSQTVCTNPADETTCTRGRRFFSYAYDVGASSTEPANTASIVMSWTMTTAQYWVLAATIVKAAPPQTAASVSVRGRVMARNGRGVSRARVMITNTITGEARYTTTNPFGYYRFTEIAVGTAYIIEAHHKSYRFPPQAVTVLDEVENLNFTTQP